MAVSQRTRTIRFKKYGKRQRVIGGIIHRIIHHGFESDVVAERSRVLRVQGSIPRSDESTLAGGRQEGTNWDGTWWCSRGRVERGERGSHL